jgi:hypothetical protein
VYRLKHCFLSRRSISGEIYEEAPPARQSAQVPVKDRQQPGAGEVLQTVRIIAGIAQRKRDGFFPFIPIPSALRYLFISERIRHC